MRLTTRRTISKLITIIAIVAMIIIALPDLAQWQAGH